MFRNVAHIFPVDLLCTKPQPPFLFRSGLLQVIIDLSAALTHCKPAVMFTHTHTKTNTVKTFRQPKVVQTNDNQPALSIRSPVEHPHFEMGDAHTPHCVEPGGADRVQVRVSTAYFIHIHPMYIALHPHWKVHLWLVWIWFCIRIDESM